MYSQYAEDDIFVPILAKDKNRRVLELGAWNATTFSNSRALIERGWSAVLVEPSPGPLRGLVNEYSANSLVTIVGAAVTVAGGMLELCITDDAVSSLAGGAEAELWKSAGGYFGKLVVPSISLESLFSYFGGDFGLVSIDVEGQSVELFMEMCRIGPRPRIVVLEHNGRHVEIASHAERASYQQVHLNGTNVVLRWTGE